MGYIKQEYLQQKANRVIELLNAWKQKGQMDEELLTKDYNNHPKWIMLIALILHDSGTSYIDATERMAAEEIYKNYVLPWKEKNKIQEETKMMNEKPIKITESDLHRIVKESVNRIISILF